MVATASNWPLQWSRHCSCMCIPIHSPWLPGYINVMQTVFITLIRAGLFLDFFSPLRMNLIFTIYSEYIYSYLYMYRFIYLYIYRYISIDLYVYLCIYRYRYIYKSDLLVTFFVNLSFLKNKDGVASVFLEQLRTVLLKACLSVFVFIFNKFKVFVTTEGRCFLQNIGEQHSVHVHLQILLVNKWIQMHTWGLKQREQADIRPLLGILMLRCSIPPRAKKALFSYVYCASIACVIHITIIGALGSLAALWQTYLMNLWENQASSVIV